MDHEVGADEEANVSGVGALVDELTCQMGVVEAEADRVDEDEAGGREEGVRKCIVSS